MINFVILCCYLSKTQSLLSDGHQPEPKLTDEYPCLSEACISVNFQPLLEHLFRGGQVQANYGNQIVKFWRDT